MDDDAERGTGRAVYSGLILLPFIILCELLFNATWSTASAREALNFFLIFAFCAGWLFAGWYFFLAARIHTSNIIRLFFVAWAIVVAEQSVQEGLLPAFLPATFTFSIFVDASDYAFSLLTLALSIIMILVGAALAKRLSMLGA